MLAAIAAFIVTTGNSYLLSAATSLTYDLYSSYLLVRLGGTPLSATDPLTGGLSMLIYAACLIPGWLSTAEGTS